MSTWGMIQLPKRATSDLCEQFFAFICQVEWGLPPTETGLLQVGGSTVSGLRSGWSGKGDGHLPSAGPFEDPSPRIRSIRCIIR